MKPIELTAANFAAETAQGLTVVDFWASWCGPCKMMAPILDEAAAALPDVKFGKVNVDEQPELANRYKVDAIPTLYFFKDGQVVNKTVGLTNKPALTSMIETAKKA